VGKKRGEVNLGDDYYIYVPRGPPQTLEFLLAAIGSFLK